MAWLENYFRWHFRLWLIRSAAHYFVMSATSTSLSYLSNPSFSQQYVPCLDILWGLPFTAELLVFSSGIWKKYTRLKGRLPTQSRYIYRQHICLFKLLAGKPKLQAQASQAIIISTQTGSWGQIPTHQSIQAPINSPVKPVALALTDVQNLQEHPGTLTSTTPTCLPQCQRVCTSSHLQQPLTLLPRESKASPNHSKLNGCTTRCPSTGKWMRNLCATYSDMFNGVKQMEHLITGIITDGTALLY